VTRNAERRARRVGSGEFNIGRGRLRLSMSSALTEDADHREHGQNESVLARTHPCNTANADSLTQSRGNLKLLIPEHPGVLSPHTVHGSNRLFQDDPHWCDLALFYEYSHGDDGSGVGASHQTDWTGLVAKLIQQSGE
jgi:hypothetical protein